MADTYTVVSWIRDRVLNELGEIVEEAADFLPLPEALNSVRVFVGKAMSQGIKVIMPRKPKFVEFPGIDPRFGELFDIVEDRRENVGMLGVRIAGYLQDTFFPDRKRLQFVLVMTPNWKKDP